MIVSTDYLYHSSFGFLFYFSEPPKFTRTPDRVSVILGSFVQICCKISGSLPISVEWQKDGSKISSGIKHKLIQQDNSVSVEIEQLERPDAGSYSCQTLTSLTRFIVLPSEPPSFVLLPESQAALPNATVRYKSTFTGTPPFTVKWFKDDMELMTGPTCFTGVDETSCFLELYSVAVAQSGIYSCQVSNDAGSVRCSADLTVKGWDSQFFESIERSLCLRSTSFHNPTALSSDYTSKQTPIQKLQNVIAVSCAFFLLASFIL
uniref:Ig-like domain-containing protein n=1 Tax=Xiphophorus maculatus TaxID=8083 RepID=A0A3B5QJT6_XIPMA